MFVGYCRSSLITILAFLIGGWSGILYFLICAILAKSFLETINYVEHYGLVRKKGERMQMRHSWNSNHLLSSVFLCNVTRHSDHHRRASLKFWELHPCPENAPMTPYGYLAMLYIVLLAPFLYQRIMEKKLEDWELHYASTEEKKLINTKLK
jgi:alkane 1-monooxygenase